jgi:TctA family transporter
MFALLVLDGLTNELVLLHFVPIVTTGVPSASVVSLILIALMIVGLALSLRSPGTRTA